MKQSQLGQCFSSLLCQVEKYTNDGDQTLYSGFWVDSRALLAMGTVSGRVCIYLHSGCCFGIVSPAEKWQHQLGKRYHLDGTIYKGLYLVHWEMSVNTNVWTRKMSKSRKRFLRKTSFYIKRDMIFFCAVYLVLVVSFSLIPGSARSQATLSSQCSSVCIQTVPFISAASSRNIL